jgi:hypothetical protein
LLCWVPNGGEWMNRDAYTDWLTDPLQLLCCIRNHPLLFSILKTPLPLRHLHASVRRVKFINLPELIIAAIATGVCWKWITIVPGSTTASVSTTIHTFYDSSSLST